MKVGVTKRPGSMLPGGVAAPLEVPLHIGGVRLLLDAFADVLLGVADLGPPVMPRNLRRRVSIDLRDGRHSGLNDLGDVDARHG